MAPKIAKKWQFLVLKCAPRPQEKFWRSIGKLEHRCTTTNLPLCNDIIIVLKIILLHSVSVITNFVIPKRGKKTDKKHHTFSSYSRRATQDPNHTWRGNRGGPCHFCTHLLLLIRSVVLPLGAIENLWGKCPHRRKMLITWVLVPRK